MCGKLAAHFAADNYRYQTLTLWRAPSTALDPVDEQRVVRVTHPFHPWLGREFVLLSVRHTWGEDRVFFLDGEGTQRSLPTGWTDAADPDPFVVLAAGRSALRLGDLVALCELVDGLSAVGAV